MSGSQSPNFENIRAYATQSPDPFLHPTPTYSPLPFRSFLDDILNTDPPPFSYENYLTSREQRRLSPYISDMPATRAAARLPNGYVDLTDEPDMPPPPEPSRKHPRSSATPGPSAKRQKRQDGARRGSQTSVAAQATEGHIEEIDLSDDKVDIQQILQKQRVDAVKAQQKPEEIKFGTSSCVICMDTPTDITATSCGHLFCHSCLMEALIAGESRTDRGEQRRSQCPVCRKHINRTKPGDTIFLNFWKLPKKSDKA